MLVPSWQGASVADRGSLRCPKAHCPPQPCIHCCLPSRGRLLIPQAAKQPQDGSKGVGKHARRSLGCMIWVFTRVMSCWVLQLICGPCLLCPFIPTWVLKDRLEPREERFTLEDELRDPANFLEYFLPRPLRITLFYGSAASCFIAALLATMQLMKEGKWEFGAGRNVLIDLFGLAIFTGLASWERSAGELRVEKRRELRQAQIRVGDREVFYDDNGEKMSRLKEVNEEWILRKLERWGRRDNMPFLGPTKGALLQQLVRERQPKLAVEVGTMAGYSALLIGQALPQNGRLVSLEKELSWVLVARRFLWQAGTGASARGGPPSRIHDKVDVQWGDALQKLGTLTKGASIELLLLDGVPKDSLAYLKAAEPHLAPGALVIADNAVVFAEGGMKPYLAYVRGNPDKYSSRTIETTLEWRGDVKDGLEVSTYLGRGAS